MRQPCISTLQRQFMNCLYSLRMPSLLEFFKKLKCYYTFGYKQLVGLKNIGHYRDRFETCLYDASLSACRDVQAGSLCIKYHKQDACVTLCRQLQKIGNTPVFISAAPDGNRSFLSSLKPMRQRIHHQITYNLRIHTRITLHYKIISSINRKNNSYDH